MSRARDIADLITAAIEANTIQSDGTITGTPTQVNTYDSDGALLAADSSGYADGSLHYMTTPRRLMLWDDSDGGFFEVTVDSDQLTRPWSIQGSQFGYTSGGSSPSTDAIDKYSFSADANATDVGNLTTSGLYRMTGHSSISHGYIAGGGPGSKQGKIQRFPFAVDENSSEMTATLNKPQYWAAGSSTEYHGYIYGSTHTNPTSAIIERFSFASDDNSSQVGSALNGNGHAAAGTSDTTHGYVTGGFPDKTMIHRYDFSSSATAADVGNLAQAATFATSSSDPTNGYGYHLGGSNPGPSNYNYVQRYAFASSGNGTDHSDLAQSVKETKAGTQSTSSGYIGGGRAGSTNMIQKFPFANNSNGTDVGDLTVGRRNAAGNQI